MPKPKKVKLKASAEASAKLGAVAKLVYARKKTITEVIPPDVTRAKAGSWLSLISPITEWAGLKGDALKYRRQQLRIQQEDSLFRLANELRKRMAGHEVLQPVPPKILVPALEKASLEASSDDVMIDRWANLLASSAQKVPVQPRFVGILGELAGSQAECLEHVAFHYVEGIKFPCKDFFDSPLVFAEYFASTVVKDLVLKNQNAGCDIGEISKSIVKYFLCPGVFLSSVLWDDPDDKDLEYFEGYDCVAETGLRRDDDLSVLESLGLIRNVVLDMDFVFRGPRSREVVLRIYYYHLTHLGVSFCEVCSRPKVLDLQLKDDQAKPAPAADVE